MSHRDTDQPRVDRDLLDQLVRENGLTPYYINDAERQDREALFSLEGLPGGYRAFIIYYL